jgi:cell division septum initiation protein DivIVA
MSSEQHDLARWGRGEDEEPQERAVSPDLRGFDREWGNRCLETVATSIQSMESELRIARAELLRARRERDSAREALEASAGLVQSSDEQVDQLRAEAEMEAESILTEAKDEADRILARVQAEADRVEARVAELRRTTLAEFRDIRQHGLTALSELQLVIERDFSSDDVVILRDGERAPWVAGAEP